MKYRTDLVLEQENYETQNINGVEIKEQKFEDTLLTSVKIKTKSAADQLQKPIGRYFTVQFPKLESLCEYKGIRCACLYALKTLLGENTDNMMVVGLGNIDITPDALGPKVAARILATRHLSGELKQTLGLTGLKSVSVLIPGVLGKTGIEASDTVKAAVKFIKPSAIIVIDALAAVTPKRLCTTFQLTDAGINPGSGVQNARKGFSSQDFGIPVIAIGMPTVIDAASYSEKTDRHNMMVTPKDIDMLIDKSSTLLADILNEFLQPSLDSETLKCLT